MNVYIHSVLFVCRLGLAAFGAYLMFANSREQSESFPPIGLAVSPSQELVAVIFEGGAITVIDLEKGNKATELEIRYHQENWWFDHGQSGVGPRTAFLDDHRLLVVATDHLNLSERTRNLTLIE